MARPSILLLGYLLCCCTYDASRLAPPPDGWSAPDRADGSVDAGDGSVGPIYDAGTDAGPGHLDLAQPSSPRRSQCDYTTTSKPLARGRGWYSAAARASRAMPSVMVAASATMGRRTWSAKPWSGEFAEPATRVTPWR